MVQCYLISAAERFSYTTKVIQVAGTTLGGCVREGEGEGDIELKFNDSRLQETRQ